MILTGAEIIAETLAGRITLLPFRRDFVNPNSYNYRLSSRLKVFSAAEDRRYASRTIVIPREGYVLAPGTLYLGSTVERIGSSEYAMSLIGRSSIGRLGLFVQNSADLGHTTSSHRWTLELVAARPIRIYPLMRIGQVSFWANRGLVGPYLGRYGRYNHPQEALGEE